MSENSSACQEDDAITVSGFDLKHMCRAPTVAMLQGGVHSAICNAFVQKHVIVRMHDAGHTPVPYTARTCIVNITAHGSTT